MSRPSTPVSSSSNPQRRTGCLRLFFLPFLAAGCFFFYSVALKPLWNVWRASDWKIVPCRIVSSEVKRSGGGSDGVTYKVAILYAYQVDGRTFQSDRYSFFTIGSSGYSGKKEIVDQYRPWSGAICYVNPENPEEAVLERGITSALWWGLFPLPFIAIGLLTFAPSWVFSDRSSKTGPLRSTRAKRRSAQHGTAGHLHDALSGPLELKASSSAKGKLIGTLVFTLFWNGIISLFLKDVWKGFSQGRPEWFLTIFLIPFVLVGLGAIAAAGYFFLNLFNPRIRLVVSSAAVPLGGKVEVQWSFHGNTRRIQDLKISLVGVERATYRRGTDTSTDEHVFAEVPLVETTDPEVISAGSEQVTIPSHLMHTFKAPNNEISWKFKVHGNIPRFPDVKEEFPLTVTPHEQASL